MGKIFDYAVKYRGRYYAAGEPIEDDAQEAAQDAQDAQEAVQEAAQEAAQEPATEEPEATAEDKPDTPKKASRSRKKGDA